MRDLASIPLVYRMGRQILTLAVAATLFGCATSGNPRDPLEPFNRTVFDINDGFDRIVAKPLAEGYRAAVPGFARTGVTNFFSNLEDFWIGINDLIQGKPGKALDDWTRVFINSTIGLLGVHDIASDLGVEKRNEDFGQTLGRWGVGSGPYVVIPFLGSSTVRDALSLGLVNSKADFVTQTSHVPTRNSLFAVRVVNLRANLLEASRIVEDAALDKYTFTRDAYLQRRRNLVYDGDPPRESRASADGLNANGTSTTETLSADSNNDVGSKSVTSRNPTGLATLHN